MHELVIQVDTREKENKHIIKYFDDMGIKHFNSKMYCGDYQLLQNPYLVIDRKANLLELVGNVTKDHKRFHDEMKRAQELSIKMIVLIEEEQIKTLDDVKRWDNPRRKYSKKATTGEQLYKILSTMSFRYDCVFLFSNHTSYPQTLIKLLKGGLDSAKQ